jgi:hypothetical protein
MFGATSLVLLRLFLKDIMGKAGSFGFELMFSCKMLR